ncbi:MAG: iron-sulfur cluster carrier protein ApbC [Salinisphaeraceae bacterium]|jgi:ATP-binding protein involved in chromosome partitioning|nr:iron-sulfur cluster carrier protein ApbC [Salinisphaeraceae bacterium]
MTDQQAVETCLNTLQLPDLEEALLAGSRIRNLDIDDGTLRLALDVGYACRSQLAGLSEQIRRALEALPGIRRVQVDAACRVRAHAVQPKATRMKSVRNIIAVSSAKGGVGKSTVAANLALGLAAEGANTGLLDADIYGPSQPLMLGQQARPEAVDEKYMKPIMAQGLQTMSMGYILAEDSPAVWRGPMVTQALTQLLNQTLWDDLDYLVVDLPPGTGDVQLTLAQKIPVSGAIIVTTPQDLALLDARRGLRMFEKVNLHVLGLVENMSSHVCSQCGHEEALFGHGGGEQFARQHGVDLLGRLPLDIRIREHADRGKPTVLADPDGELAQRYRQIARRAAARLALRPRDYSASFPKIKVVSRPE